METTRIILQVIIALGILNVWVLRFESESPWRGGGAKNMKEEFAEYGLPFWFLVVVGSSKVLLAILLLVGIWIPQITAPAAVGLGVLMLGAVVMHFKVGDPLRKAIPALSVLVLCVIVAILGL